MPSGGSPLKVCSESPTAAETTRVTFRFVGPYVDPDLVTRHLGILPASAHRKGDVRANRPDLTFQTGFWGIDSALPETEPIGRHISHVLDMLEPRAEPLRR